MIKNQIRTYYKSLINFIMVLAAAIPVALSYYETYLNKQMVVDALQSAESLAEKQEFQHVIDGMNGLAFFLNYIFSSDYLMLTVLILSLGLCVVAGTANRNHLNNGYGNLLVVRTGFKRYLFDLVISQIVYTFTYVCAFFAIIFCISLAWSFPESFSNISSNINIRDFSIVPIVLIMCAQIILIAAYITLTNTIAALSCVFVFNKYLIQTIPLIIFFVPFLVAVFLGTVPAFQNLLSWVAPSNYLLSIYYIFCTEQTMAEEIMSLGLLPVLLVVLFSFLLYRNLCKFGDDYL